MPLIQWHYKGIYLQQAHLVPVFIKIDYVGPGYKENRSTTLVMFVFFILLH
jgi:hypothetical protein